MPIMILGLGLVLMLALGGGGGSAKAALPPKKDERGDLDIVDPNYKGQDVSVDPDLSDIVDPTIADTIKKRGGGKGSDGGGGSGGKGGSENSLIKAREAEQQHIRDINRVQNTIEVRNNTIRETVITQRQGQTDIRNTQNQIRTNVQQAKGMSEFEKRALAAAEQATRGRLQAEQAAAQQAANARAALDAANAAAEQARNASSEREAQALKQRADALAAAAAQHQQAAEAAQQAANQKLQQEQTAREAAERAHQLAEDKIREARELAEKEKGIATKLAEEIALKKEEIARKNDEVKQAAANAAEDRKNKNKELQDAEDKRKGEALATLKENQAKLRKSQQDLADAEKERQRAAREAQLAKTAADKQAAIEKARQAAVEVQNRKQLLAEEKAAGLLAIKNEKIKQDTIKREFIKQAFLNAVERCMTFNPGIDRQKCINNVAKLFNAKGIPLGTKLGNFELKSVEQVQKAVGPLPLLIVPPQAKRVAPAPGPKPGPGPVAKTTPKPAPKTVAKKPPSKPNVGPAGEFSYAPDYDRVNKDLLDRATMAVSEYLNSSIKKYPAIKANFTQRGFKTNQQLVYAFVLPSLFGRQPGRLTNVKDPEGKTGARYVAETTQDAIFAALDLPREEFKRRLLNGLINVENVIDSAGNATYKSKWFVNGKARNEAGRRAVSFLYKQFVAPTAPAVSGYLTIAGTPPILNDIYTGPGSEPGGGFLIRLGGWNS